MNYQDKSTLLGDAYVFQARVYKIFFLNVKILEIFKTTFHAVAGF